MNDKEEYSFGAMLIYQNEYTNDRVYEAYGVVTLSVKVEELITERKMKISRYGDVWGDKDYYINTDDLTDQWYVMEAPEYTGTFVTYSDDYIGEDDGTGILSWTTPDGTIVSRDVYIEGSTSAMKFLAMGDGHNMVTTWTITPE